MIICFCILLQYLGLSGHSSYPQFVNMPIVWMKKRLFTLNICKYGMEEIYSCCKIQHSITIPYNSRNCWEADQCLTRELLKFQLEQTIHDIKWQNLKVGKFNQTFLFHYVSFNYHFHNEHFLCLGLSFNLCETLGKSVHLSLLSYLSKRFHHLLNCLP